MKRDSERVAEGYDRALDLLRESKRQRLQGAAHPAVREALDTLEEDELLDRQIAMFWLDLSYDQLQKRINTQPPPSPYPPKRQGRATKRAVLDWDREWRSIEAQQAHARVLARGRPMLLLQARQPWLVFSATRHGTVIFGHAERLDLPVEEIARALRDGATIRWLTVTNALQKFWALESERDVWQFIEEGVQRQD